VEVGSRALEVGIWGAYKNVLINLPGIKDEAFKAEKMNIAEEIKDRAMLKCEEVLGILKERK
jgi:glutamate formiminotransferase/formiminotetrahydrofolate cyclodeaminase